MRELVLLCTLLVVGAGCGSAPPSADWQAQARDAYETGNADTYLRLTRQAAHAGDLDALAVMAEAASRGYVRVGRDPDTWTNVPVRVWPGEAARWRRRFVARLDAGVAAGEPEARFLRAELRTGRHPLAHRMRDAFPQTRQDSLQGEADLLALAEEDHVPSMWIQAHRVGFRDPAGAKRWIDRLQAAGDSTACRMEVSYWSKRAHASASGLSGYLDAAMACPDMAVNARLKLEALAREAGQGNAPARALADSLVALGVYDRHPSLTAPG